MDTWYAYVLINSEAIWSQLNPASTSEAKNFWIYSPPN